MFNGFGEDTGAAGIVAALFSLLGWWKMQGQAGRDIFCEKLVLEEDGHYEILPLPDDLWRNSLMLTLQSLYCVCYHNLANGRPDI